jgi:hypothetical protein
MLAESPQNAHGSQFPPLLVQTMSAILMFGKSTAICATKQHEEHRTTPVLHLEMACLLPNTE